MIATINQILEAISDFLWGDILVFGLIAVSIYFTIRTKGVQFRLLGDMFKLLTERSTHKGDAKTHISSFKAFTIGAASRIGTGNMAGIGVAIALGGPGAIFWMWVASLLGAATGFIESTLAQVYKTKDGDNYKGGPSYYIQQHLNARWLGIIFSILVMITFGLVFNATQANTIAVAFENSFHTHIGITGLVLAVLTGLVITGGVVRISHYTQILVPIIAIIYLGLALTLLSINFKQIPEMFSIIMSHAFGWQEIAGGSIGGAILVGVKRGLFSNEAGMGSVPHAAATADISHPAKQGLVQALGVFIDTIFICSATAFMILLSDQYLTTNLTGIELLQASLSSTIGSWAGVFISCCIFLFAFSSLIGNYYYGEANCKFIWRDNKQALWGYRLLVLITILLGSLAKVTLVWNLVDIAMASMAIINLIVISILGSLALRVLNDYIKQRREGKDPVFNPNHIKGIRGKTVWDED